MKKLTIVISICILIISCKKTETQPANSALSASSSIQEYKKGKITVYVESNYQYPYLAIEVGGSGGQTLNRINQYPNYTKAAPYTHSFSATTTGRYRLYMITSKNAADSTKYMTDGLPVWHRIKVSYNDTIVIADTTHNSLSDATYTKGCQTEYFFDIK